MSKLKEYLDYYRHKLERNINDVNIVEATIQKLNKVDVTPDALLNTGVYKVVRGISKSGSELSEKALPLYTKWKALILESQNDGRKSCGPQNIIPQANPSSDLPGNRINDAANTFNKSAKIQKEFNDSKKNNAHSIDNGACIKSEFDIAITPLLDLDPILDSYTPLLNNLKSLPNESRPSSSSLKSTSNNFKPFSNDSKPPSNSFKPFSNDSKPPSNNFKPFINDTKPPSNSFKPLINDSKPSSNNFKPLSNDSKPSSNSFKPLSNEAKPLLNNFKPLPDDPKLPLNDFKPFSNHFKSSSTHFKPLSNDFKVTLNDIQIPDEFKPSISTNAKITECNDLRRDGGSSNDSSAPFINSNSFASPHSSNSQNSAELLAITNTSSPNKVKIPEPYAIEMKEGMFRVVKSYEDTPPDIVRIRKLYNGESDESPSKESSHNHSKTPKKRESSPKNCKTRSDKSSEKKSAKSKAHVDKAKKDLKSTFDKNSVKSLKAKSNSPLSKSAIEKSKTKETDKKAKEKPKFSNSERKLSPLTITNKATVTPVAGTSNSVHCDTKKETGHKNCDKKAVNKVLSNDVAGKFISSKKERTSVYSGKRPSQDISSLKHGCIRVLRKNIESIRSTMSVPYKELKPVLQCCSASQLKRIEENNKHLIKDTDDLWKSFCQKKFHQTPQPHESWRDLYWRLRTEQDRKLKNLTASISASMSKAGSERQAKLVESPENHKSKRIKLSNSESSDAAIKLPKPSAPKIPKEGNSSSHNSQSSSHHKIQPKDSSAKTSLKDSPSFGHKSHKESTSTHKKSVKKTNCAPLMSKVKKTVGLLAMHKK